MVKDRPNLLAKDKLASSQSSRYTRPTPRAFGEHSILMQSNAMRKKHFGSLGLGSQTKRRGNLCGFVTWYAPQGRTWAIMVWELGLTTRSWL